MFSKNRNYPHVKAETEGMVPQLPAERRHGGARAFGSALRTLPAGSGVVVQKGKPMPALPISHVDPGSCLGRSTSNPTPWQSSRTCPKRLSHSTHTGEAPRPGLTLAQHRPPQASTETRGWKISLRPLFYNTALQVNTFLI